MKKKNDVYIYLTPEEFSNSRMRDIIKELINRKFQLQKYHDFIKVSKSEFELIQNVFRGEFVDKAKYNNMTNFKGEIGKCRGKRVIIVEN